MATTFNNTVEPAYEYEMDHLDESEALDRYAQERRRHPGAIVSIEGLDCGEHFDVKVYDSNKEKQVFYRKRISKLFDNLWDALKT